MPNNTACKKAGHARVATAMAFPCSKAALDLPER